MSRTMQQAVDVLNICLLETRWHTVNVDLHLLYSQNAVLMWTVQAVWRVLRMNVWIPAKNCHRVLQQHSVEY